jgi:hypothetical protein
MNITLRSNELRKSESGNIGIKDRISLFPLEVNAGKEKDKHQRMITKKKLKSQEESFDPFDRFDQQS